MVDGDTFDVEGIGRIRLADVNTPEIDTEEGKEAKEYVKGLYAMERRFISILMTFTSQVSMAGLLLWFMCLTTKLTM